jgi:phage head maturation protease
MSIENVDVAVKDLGPLEIKDHEKGEVEAVIATLGVVDRDGDIITASAIKSGSKVIMSRYGHDAVYGESPVGKGALHVDGESVLFRGKMFLSTDRGREIFNVLKEMGSDQQWSFGFRVLGAEVPDDDARAKGASRILTKLDAFEVSPVLQGAGIGTHTVAMKAAKEAAEAAAAEDEPVAEVEPVVEDAPEPEPPADEEKADEPDDLEAKRLEAEAKEAGRREAELKDAAADEFDRFQRTLRRMGIAA